jgi:hypothetical protein
MTERGETEMPDSRTSDTRAATIIHPSHCRFSGAADRSALALTFHGGDAPIHSVVLPVAGAAGLQRQLAQCLHLLGVRPVVPAPVAEPAGTQSESVPSAM